jgi:hypothetical protein
MSAPKPYPRILRKLMSSPRTVRHFPTREINRYDQELVYLIGGENRPEEIADFPDLDRRLVKPGGILAIHKLSDGKPFFEGAD